MSGERGNEHESTSGRSDPDVTVLRVDDPGDVPLPEVSGDVEQEELATGGAGSYGREASVSHSEEEDEDEEEEPPELKAAGQQDFPPTPYEECLDLRIFEMHTEPTGATEHSESQGESEPSHASNSDSEETHHKQDQNDVLVADEQNATRDQAVPDDALCDPPEGTSEPDADCYGVRRKGECPANGSGTQEENQNQNGTKKKVRPNRLSPEVTAAGGRSRKKQFWAAAASGAVDDCGLPRPTPGQSTTGSFTLDSPTKLHRPLERSWPPKPGQQRSTALLPQGAEGFSFDIIDMDEQDVEGAVGGLFCETSRRPDEDGNVPTDASSPLRLMRLDRNGNESPSAVTTEQPPKLPLKKATRNALPARHVSPEREEDISPPPLPVRPHRPLVRTQSNGREPRTRESRPPRPLPVERSTTPPSVHTVRSPGSPQEPSPESVALGNGILPPARPQPRPLTRVGAGPRALPDLVCPPTPTHHARRHRVASAAAPADGFGPPELRLARPDVEDASGQFPDDAPVAIGPSLEHEGAAGDVGAVRHVPSMRLPSIPERARAILAEPDDSLPPAWEARMDSHGRIFYIDHATRTTSWQRPAPPGSSAVLGHGPDPHRQQLDRRYQSIRRTIYEHMRHEAAGPVRASTSGVAWQASDGATTSHSGRPRSSSTGGRPREQLPVAPVPPTGPPVPPTTEPTRPGTGSFHPALLMICRSDFYSMLHTNGDAIQIYNRNAALKHMVSRVRRDPGCFGRYQHNRDLVALVNCFALTAQDLPSGWETKLDQSGKQFFIDHVNRRTSFMDPRLPTEGPRARHHRPPTGTSLLLAGPFPDERPIPPPRPPATISRLAHASSPEVPVAYNDKVVAFLRQPNILEILRERHGAAACSRNLREKINAIRVEGTTALDRFSHDLELTILLSLFEEEVMTYVPPRARSPPEQSSPSVSNAVKAGGRHVQRAPAPMRRDFEAKLRNFYRKLESKGYGQGPHKLRLEVRRAHLVDDAFERIMAASRRDLQRCRLNIVWDTEDGLDYGGPSREFFYLLSRQLFSPYRKMFEYSANDIYTVQIAPERPTEREDILEWYRFSGRVLGLALVHQYLLDAFFTRPFYKALLRLPVSLSDLESLDSSFHQSLLWIRDNNMDSCSELGLNFTVTEERSDGSSIDIELKPNGRNITVSERNKRDYLERIIKWRLERGVLEQTEWLVRGFNEVVDHRLVSVFDASELELVISGTVEIDVHDWRANTEYRGGYHDSHHVIVWFWAVIDRLSNEQRLRLLQFVTGTSSIPHDGFAGLRGSNGLRRFCIEKWGKSNALPRSHTCFNRLDLPPYPTPDVLYEKLVLAVEETNTFGIE
ncbi:E3 ubiquitin-protein ligase HECW2 [Anopheles nili]|uniref:E3 ubiquitin-protein ligase HECW2 n=1 Tax=Anopheles nili TaxID=185578 RepID=UPI00237C4FCA|nr:E3 ubiquitin-protein ligase HECW2 [Anopheles nili]